MHQSFLILILFLLWGCGGTDADKNPGETSPMVEAPNNDSNSLEPPSGPVLSFDGRVEFSRVRPVTDVTRDFHWRLLEITNTGDESLIIYRIEVTGVDSPFSVSYPTDDLEDPSRDSLNAPGTLKAGESLAIRVYFNPRNNSFVDQDLMIVTNDPEVPDFRVPMRGNFGPCVYFSEDVIDFGEAGIGDSAQFQGRLINCSSEKTYELEVLELSNAQGVEVESAHLTISPSDTLPITLTFAPQLPGDVEGTLDIHFQAEEYVITIPVRAKGRFPCPQAFPLGQIEIDGVLQGTPATLLAAESTGAYLNLDASRSSSPNGEITSYEWTVVQRPTSSVSRVEPSSNSVNPRLLLDATGRYIVELSVTDASRPSCNDENTSRVTVDVGEFPRGIRVELTWSSPSDPDETDTHGTDMDLHYLHPSGSWNQSPWDIYWRNRTADWPPIGDAGDPHLVLDDRDGVGPEILEHAEPQSNIIFQVGVYYYADKGFGASFATLRIWIDDGLVWEMADKEMGGTGVFWQAAAISWPSRQVIVIDQKTQGFPNPN